MDQSIRLQPRKKKVSIPQITLQIFVILLALVVVLPFVIIVSISLSNEQTIALEGYGLFPKNFDLSAYEFLFQDIEEIIQAYGVTAFFSFASMVLGTFLMSLIAYVLSVRNFKGRNAISFYLFFTMLFSGGLVPTYILITQYLHLNNKIWVYILPTLIGPWNVFMIRSFFQGIPYEITESAIVDGAGHFVIYSKLIVPLSKPVLATVALNVFLGKWNDWNTSLLYISDKSLRSLQYLLQEALLSVSMIQNMPQASMYISSQIPTETVRMAMAVVVAGPALLIFPFFQKYFVKGLTLGSVKG